MKFEGFTRFKLDRDVASLAPGKWTSAPCQVSEGNPRKMYMKIYRNADLEILFGEAERAKDHEERVPHHHEKSSDSLGQASAIREPISTAEALKITEEMMCSFSENRTVRELLEGALHFAGAVTLGGAVAPRRARTQITRFELN